jgi:hypothetical protein
MTDIIKETVVTQANTTEATSSQTAEYLIYFAFGLLEVLLAFRLLLKLTGASTASGFVSAIYGVTGIFILPFAGIFNRLFAQGVGAGAVLEPSTLVAIIFYIFLGWGIVKLVRIFSGEKQID